MARAYVAESCGVMMVPGGPAFDSRARRCTESIQLRLSFAPDRRHRYARHDTFSCASDQPQLARLHVL